MLFHAWLDSRRKTADQVFQLLLHFDLKLQLLVFLLELRRELLCLLLLRLCHFFADLGARVLVVNGHEFSKFLLVGFDKPNQILSGSEDKRGSEVRQVDCMRLRLPILRF